MVEAKCIGMAIKLAVERSDIMLKKHKCQQHNDKTVCNSLDFFTNRFSEDAQRLRDECPGFGEHF